MDKQLRYVVSAVDKGAGKTITGVGEKGESAGKKLSAGFAKAGQFIGGEFGEILNKASEGLENFGEHGLSVGKKISALGAGVAGVGAALTIMGQKEKQATDELANSIANNGGDIADFTEEIEKSVKAMERYGDEATTTKHALTILTDATHDPAKALDLLAGAADLAAASHISLDDASTQLGKALNGSGRIFKQYGIQVKVNADGTKDYAGAVEQLTTKLHGRADAAADNLTGKLKHLRAEVTDDVAVFGEKYGPAITGAGVAMIALGPLVGKGATFIKKLGTTSTAAAVEVTAADEAIIAGNHAAAVSEGELAVASQAAATKIVASDAEVVAANTAARTSFLGFASALGIVGTAALILPSINGNQIDSSNELVAAYKEQTKSTDLSAKSILKWAADAKVGGGVAMVVTDPVKHLKLSTDALAEGVSGSDEEYKKWITTLKAHGKVSGNDKQALDQLHKVFKDTVPAVKELTDATDDNTDALARYKQKADAAKMASELYTKSLQTLGQTELSTEQTQDGFLDSLDQLTQAVKDNGHSLDQNTAKGRANREQLTSSLSAALGHANAQRANGASIRGVTKDLNANVAQLIRTATQAGLSKPAVDALVKAMGLTPKQIETKFKADTAPAYDAFTKMVDDLRAAAANSGIIVRVNAEGGLETTRGGTRFNAGGEDFTPGGSVIIAERETEVAMPRGYKTVPMSKLHGDATSTSVHLTVNTITTDQQFGRWLVGQLETVVRNGYKIKGLTN